MKKLLALALSLCMLATMFVAPAMAEGMKPGTYTATAKGMFDGLTVEVTVSENAIEKIEVTAHQETAPGWPALEKIPAALATRVAKEVSIPVIGIGAGGGVDGQVLVMHDMLGINKGFSPRFLRRYADVGTIINDAVAKYVDDVKTCDFPNENEQY